MSIAPVSLFKSKNNEDKHHDIIGKLSTNTNEDKINPLAIITDKKSTVSDLFDIKIILKFRRRFAKSAIGKNKLPAVEFKALLSEYIPEKEIDFIYEKIDVNDEGVIKFSDFINTLIAAEDGSSFANNAYANKLVSKLVQEDDNHHIHKDNIDHLCFVLKPRKMIITGGRDGQISIWDAEDLWHIGNIYHRDKNSIFLEKFMNNKRTNSNQAKYSTTSTTKMAITGLCPLPLSCHLCVGSTDCSITIYDIATQECVWRINDLEYIPTCISTYTNTVNSIDYAKFEIENSSGVDGDNILPISLEAQRIAFGDAKGVVRFLELDPNFGIYQDGGAKKRNQLIIEYALKNSYYAVDAHTDWITSLLCIRDINAFVSSSMDGNVCIIDLEKKQPARYFNGHSKVKTGVKAFSWSADGKYIISAGGRSLLLWDPFTLKTVMVLDGISALIIDVKVYDSAFKIFAILNDKKIRIWHNVTYEPLQTVTDTAMYRQLDSLTAMLFVPEMDRFYSAGNKITLWSVESSASNVLDDIEEDLCAALYNTCFQQVVIVTTFGKVSVYEGQSGMIIRQFNVGHISSIVNLAQDIIIPSGPAPLNKDPLTGLSIPIVKFACFDKQHRRLIITRCDGLIQTWNFINGSCISSIKPILLSNNFSSSSPESISTVSYEISLIKQREKQKKFLVVGTESGMISCLQDLGEEFDSSPSECFRRTKEEKNDSLDNNRPESEAENIMPSVTEWVSPFKNKNNSSLFEESSLLYPNDLENIKKSDLGHGSVLWILAVSATNLAFGYSDGHIVVWNMETAIKSLELISKETGPILVAGKIKIPLVKEKFDRKKSHFETGSTYNKRKSTKLMKRNTIIATTANNGKLIGLGGLTKICEDSDNEGRDLEDIDNDNNDNILSEQVLSLLKKEKSRNHTMNQESQQLNHSNKESNNPSRLRKSKPTMLTVKAISASHKPLPVALNLSGVVDNNTNNTGGIFTLHPPGLGFPSERGRRVSIMGKDGNLHISSILSTITPSSPPKSNQLVNTLNIENSNSSRKEEKRPTNLLGSMLSPHKIRLGVSSIDSSSTSSNQASEQIPTLLKKSTVETAVVYSNPLVLIGACSDKLIRFWDMESGRVLCSCKYWEDNSETENKSPNRRSSSIRSQSNINILLRGKKSKKVAEEETLRYLTLSDMENLLIGAFDHGLVRVWNVNAHVLKNLKKLYDSQKNTVNTVKGLGITPIQLVSEWVAHNTIILSIAYVYFPFEEKLDNINVWEHDNNGLEESNNSNSTNKNKLNNANGDENSKIGFIITASIDQQVHMWRVDGKYVGTFGPFCWDINDEKTWIKRLNLDKNENNGQVKLLPKPPDVVKSSGIFKKNSELIRKSISIGDDNKRPIGKPTSLESSHYKPKHSYASDELNDYVDKLNEKISSRPPISCAFNEQIGGVMVRHPIIPIKTKTPTNKPNSRNAMRHAHIATKDFSKIM